VREGVRFALVALLVALSWLWGCKAETRFSGEWESILHVVSSTETWVLDTDFTVEVTSGDWIAAARSVFKNNTWRKQEFDIEVALGKFGIELDLRFEPHRDRFKDLIAQLEWETDMLAFAVTTKLTRTTDWMIVDIERDTETIEIDLSVRFRAPSNSCQAAFYDTSLEFDFDWCGIETDLEIAIDNDGFDECVLEFSDLDFARVPWSTFDLEFSRTARKTVVKSSSHVTLASALGTGTCEIEIEGTCPDSPNAFSLEISEVVLTWGTGEWEFEATAILDPSDWIAKTYWFEFQADTSIDLDSNREVALEFIFLWTGADLERSRLAVAYKIADSFTIAIEGDFNVKIGQVDRLTLNLEADQQINGI